MPSLKQWFCLGVVLSITMYAAVATRKSPSSFNIASGVGAIFIKNGKVLTVFRNSPVELNNHKHGLIGGLVQEGESVRQGAARKIFEEVGVLVDQKDLTLVHTMSSTEHGIETVGHYFLVEKWDDEPYNKASHKHAYIEWLDLNNLPATLIPRNRQALDNMRREIAYSEYGWQ